MKIHLRTNTGEDNGAKLNALCPLEEGPRRNDFLEQLKQELRTPLNTIMGCAELLEGQCGTASMTDKVKQIIKAAHESLDIINRDFAKPDDDHYTPNGAEDSQCDVLHIEDDSASFASVKLLLGSKRKLKVLQAISGENGIALAQTHAPKLVLLDLDLPGIHGSEVIRRLKEQSLTAHIPVIVLSGDSTSSQIERLLVLGAQNYVTKPFKPKAFLAIVDDILDETAGSN
jgi:CheY-like chemotaxis protein